jgi:hypothetical protein
MSGLIYYLYRFYDPNSQRWLNRDPIAEFGFEMNRLRRAELVQAVEILERSGNNNLYAFVRNRPIGAFDALGLAPGTPTGPNTLACIAAKEQLDAAIALFKSEPSAQNGALVATLTAAATAACKPPPPPPPVPPWCPPSRWVPPYIPPPTPAQQCTLALEGGVLTVVCIILLSPIGL